MPGISPDKGPPRLIYHRRALRNELLLRALTGMSFFTIRDDARKRQGLSAPSTSLNVTAHITTVKGTPFR